MIRYFLRFCGTVALAAAAIMAVLDIARSLETSRLVATPLTESLNGALPEVSAALQDSGRRWLGEAGWQLFKAAVFDLPGWIILGAAAFVLLALGARPRRDLRYRTLD